MIEIVFRDGPDDFRACPALVCDNCRRQVVGQGIILWAERSEPSRVNSPMFVAHKGLCDEMLKSWLDKQYPVRDNWIDAWEEATKVVPDLAYNAVNTVSANPDVSLQIVPVVHPSKPMATEP